MPRHSKIKSDFSDFFPKILDFPEILKIFEKIQKFTVFFFETENSFFEVEKKRYSFDVEFYDLSIYEVSDAQLRKLKKLQRVEHM